MAEQKTSPLLWIGLIGGAAALWWYMKNKGTTSTDTSTALLPSLQPTGQAPNPTQLLPVANTPMVQAPQGAALTLSSQSPVNGIDPTVYATVQKWAQGVGTPPVMAFAAAAVPAEYAGIYDLYTNVWTAGKQPDQAQVDFWNNLRAKYDPTHQYW